MGNSEKRHNVHQAILRASASVVLIVLVLVLSFYLATNTSVVGVVSQLGYLGVFFIALFSGFNVVAPVPAATFLPVFLAAGLSFWSLLILITVGMTIGDTVGFFIGNAGRKLTAAHVEEVRNGKMFRYIEHFRSKHRLWPYVLLVLYVAFAPAPNEILVMPMAFAGYPLRRILPVILVGNFVFNILVAFGVFYVAGLF